MVRKCRASGELDDRPRTTDERRSTKDFELWNLGTLEHSSPDSRLLSHDLFPILIFNCVYFIYQLHLLHLVTRYFAEE